MRREARRGKREGTASRRRPATAALRCTWQPRQRRPRPRRWRPSLVLAATASSASVSAWPAPAPAPSILEKCDCVREGTPTKGRKAEAQLLRRRRPCRHRRAKVDPFVRWILHPFLPISRIINVHGSQSGSVSRRPEPRAEGRGRKGTDGGRRGLSDGRPAPCLLGGHCLRTTILHPRRAGALAAHGADPDRVRHAGPLFILLYSSC